MGRAPLQSSAETHAAPEARQTPGMDESSSVWQVRPLAHVQGVCVVPPHGPPAFEMHPAGGLSGTHWQSVVSQWSPFIQRTLSTQVTGHASIFHEQVPVVPLGTQTGPATCTPSGQSMLGTPGSGPHLLGSHAFSAGGGLHMQVGHPLVSRTFPY